MGRMYAASFENVSISAAQDLFELTPYDDKPIALHALLLSNVGGTADAGDAQEELLRLTVVRGNSTSGSNGGTPPTPVPLSAGDTAAGFTVEINNTTTASGGTALTLLADGWNIRIPYQMIWTPETRPIAKEGALLCVRLPSAPADAVTCSGTVYVEELA